MTMHGEVLQTQEQGVDVSTSLRLEAELAYTDCMGAALDFSPEPKKRRRGIGKNNLTRVLVLVTLAFGLASCANASSNPSPEVVASSTPTTEAVPTMTAAPTETATEAPTVAPTETAMPTFEIASMAEFDQAWYKEVGKVVEVADLYGAGAATITVEAEKLPAEGQVFAYEEMEKVNTTVISFLGKKLEVYLLRNLKVESMSLVSIDVADNSVIADGKWCLFKFGTLRNGKLVHFGILADGNLFMNTTSQQVFDGTNVGDMVGMSFEIFPSGGVTLEKFAKNVLVKRKLAVTDYPNYLFSELLFTQKGITIDEVMKGIEEGIILGEGIRTDFKVTN